jgi:hypothetical protein
MEILEQHLAISETEEAPMINEQEIENLGINEAPHANEQVVGPQQPHEENNEPQSIRRSLQERKNAISDDYIVYMNEDVNVTGKMDDPTSYKEVMMSKN